MSQTLRRELRLKFLEELKTFRVFSAINVDTLSERLADAALEVYGISKQEPKGIDWAIAADLSSEQVAAIAKKEQSEKDRTILFEKEMGYSSLPWWSDRKLERVLRFLLTKTPEEIHTFAVWCKRDFSSFSPSKARQYPNLIIELFPQAFPSTPEAPKRPSILDEDESKWIPAPERK